MNSDDMLKNVNTYLAKPFREATFKLSHGISRWQRLRVIILSAGLALGIFHHEIGCGLVQQGDGLLATSHLSQALRVYQRAAWFDPQAEDIAQRISFAAYLSGNHQAQQQVVAHLHSPAAQASNNTVFLVDSALCATRVGAYAEAAWAFARAGRLEKNPQLLVLAGWAQAHCRCIASARLLWQEALAMSPRYQQAQHALQHIHTVRDLS